MSKKNQNTRGWHALVPIIFLIGCSSIVSDSVRTMEINKNPGKFDGRTLRLTGFIAFTSEGTFFYSTCKGFRNVSFADAIKIDRVSMVSVRNVSKEAYRLHGKEVTLSGKIDASEIISRTPAEKIIGGWVLLKNINLTELQPNKNSVGDEKPCSLPQQ